jgi:hypothetical protein
VIPAASLISDFWNDVVADFWSDQVVREHREGVFLVLVGFIGSFAFIRMSTRLMRSPRVPWWPGSVETGGVHVHHLVFGICTMIAAGTMGFAFFDLSPWFEISAGLFGIGAGLTIDEFALWVYLDDVYWAEEGRKSIDATVIAAAGMLLILFGFSPFDFTTGSAGQLIGSLAGAVLVLALVAICFLKDRIMHGWVGFFVLPVAIYGAARIGKPGSPWARRFYADRRPAKQARAEARFPPDRRTERFKQRFRDLVGGVTEEEYQAQLAQETATRETAEKMRRRAERVP